MMFQILQGAKERWEFRVKTKIDHIPQLRETRVFHMKIWFMIQGYLPPKKANCFEVKVYFYQQFQGQLFAMVDLTSRVWNIYIIPLVCTQI